MGHSLLATIRQSVLHHGVTHAHQQYFCIMPTLPAAYVFSCITMCV